MHAIKKMLEPDCFQSNCIEEMQAKIARNYCDHRLNIERSNTDLTGKFFKMPLRGMTLNFLSYGADVSIDAGDFETFYMLEFPLSGKVELQLGSEEYATGAKTGALVSPGVYVKSKWSADCSQLMLKIEKDALHSYLQKSIMRDVDETVVFEKNVPFDEGPGAGLFSYLRFIIEQSLVDDSLMGSPLVRHEMEESIFAILIDKFPHSYSDDVRSEYALVLPRHVSKAYKYIKANAQEAISNEVLAQIAGVSTRTLYVGFNKFLGMSPQIYLRNYRLERVNDELKQAPSNARINEIAQKWGFTHMGRFSRDFKERFGVAPSSILRF